MEKEENISKELFYLSENSIYQMINKFEKSQMVDKSLVYCFTKAFYLNSSRLYIEQNKLKFNFDTIYTIYKQYLRDYYKTNNPTIEDILLDQVMNFFDNSYSLIGTVEQSNIDDSYEFRHYTINVFELLRMILEKNSKKNIRTDLFENNIREIIEQTENIWSYLKTV